MCLSTDAFSKELDIGSKYEFTINIVRNVILKVRKAKQKVRQNNGELKL